ncbi:MAG: hypothetical protein KDA36_12680, partial [Planctomycetaceae bacterium]|nr:hypothetical protein [Planctomycetaceae bacterium]
MTRILLPARRRRATTPSIAPLEPCETRLLLSAAAIYPAQISIPSSDSESAASPVLPAATAIDYQGAWTVGVSTLIINLSGSVNSPKAK